MVQLEKQRVNWGIILPIQTGIFAVANGIFHATISIYLLRTIALSPSCVGQVIGLGAALGIITSLLSGRIMDTRGPLSIWQNGVLGEAIFLTIMAISPNKGGAACGVTGSLALSAISNNARIAYTYNAVPEQYRRNVQARVRSILFSGMAVGAGIAGLYTAQMSAPMWRDLILATAGLFFVNALYMRTLPRLERVDPAYQQPLKITKKFIVISSIMAAMMVNEIFLTIVFPLWILRFRPHDTSIASTLLLANTILIIIFQVRISRWTTQWSSVIRIILAATAFCLSCVIIYPTRYFTDNSAAICVLIITTIGAIVYSLGQMILSTVSWDIFAAITTPEARGRYQAIWQATTQVVLSIAPIIVTSIINQNNALAIIAVAMLLFGLLGAGYFKKNLPV